MRVLFITYHYPPYAAIGAVRTGRTAELLSEFGHDVRVVTAAKQPLEQSLHNGLPRGSVRYANWAGASLFSHLARAPEPSTPNRGVHVGRGWAEVGRRSAKWVWRNALYVPDPQVGWVPSAVICSQSAIAAYRPDVILASAWPVSSLIAACLVASHEQIPWVAELRDLWCDNPYRELRRWQRCLDRRLEERVLGQANGIVVVSRTMADQIRERFATPVVTVFNGYDDLPLPMPRPVEQARVLTLVHAGQLYARGRGARPRRDPTALFEGLRLLGAEMSRVEVHFYGPDAESVLPLAEEHGVATCVRVHGRVPRQRSIEAQAAADVLLLLLARGAAEKGVVSGKLFEYMSSGRPILAICDDDNEGGEIVRRSGCGFSGSTAGEVAEVLRRCLVSKDRSGSVRTTGRPVDFSRASQVRVLEAFLNKVAFGG